VARRVGRADVVTQSRFGSENELQLLSYEVDDAEAPGFGDGSRSSTKATKSR
jgi:hypothetical protein